MRRALAIAAAALAAAACGDRWKAPEPGLVLSAPSPVTTESGGTATLSIALADAPSGAVEVEVFSGDGTEGAVVDAATGVAGLGTSIRFTPADWNVPKTVTVVGVDDDAADGDARWDAVVSVSASEDARYSALDAARVAFTNLDDDTPAIRLSRTSLETWEDYRTTASFTVVLAKRPAGTVVVPVASAWPSEGRLRASTLPNVADAQLQLVFTPSDWSVPREVTVEGQRDWVADGDQEFAVIVGPATGDAAYAALPPQPVSVVNRDVDGPSMVSPSPASVDVDEGATVDLCVSTVAAPTAEVSIPVRSGDAAAVLLAPSGTGGPFGEAVTLTLGPARTSACVTVLGVRDFRVTGTRLGSISIGPTASAARAWDGQPDRLVEVAIRNVDLPP